eukprot:Nk52_evm9s485 gene=Nk52_evmTU9s485
MAQKKSSEDRRFARVSLTVHTYTVILNTGNMILDATFLRDVTRLPLLNVNDTRPPLEQLKDNKMNEQYYEYFKFFSKYGTHYRRRSEYGGNLQFVYSVVKSKKITETQFEQNDEYCSNASFKASYSKNGDDVGSDANGSQNEAQNNLYGGQDGSQDPNTSIDPDIQDMTMGDWEAEEVASSGGSPLTGGAGVGSGGQEGNAWDTSSINKDTSNMRGVNLESYCLLPLARAEALQGNDLVSNFLTEAKRLYPKSGDGGRMRRRRSLKASNFRRRRSNVQYMSDFSARPFSSMPTVKDNSGVTPNSGSPSSIGNSPVSGTGSGDSSGAPIIAHGPADNWRNPSDRAEYRGDQGSFTTQQPKDELRKSLIILKETDNLQKSFADASGASLADSMKALAESEKLLEENIKLAASGELGTVADENRDSDGTSTNDEGLEENDGDAADASEEASKLQSKPPKDIGAKLDMSYAKCMSQFEQRSDMQGVMSSKDKYDVFCDGGISCNGLLFIGDKPPSVMKSELMKWAASVWNYPAYLKSAANEYVELHEIFEDTIHFKGEKAEYDPEILKRLRKSVFNRKKSMSMALNVYFLIHSMSLDGTIFCSHLACSVPPTVLANGDCACADTMCRFDLLTRIAQAGGAYSGDNTGIMADGTVLRAACDKDKYFDAVTRGCRGLTDGRNPACFMNSDARKKNDDLGKGEKRAEVPHIDVRDGKCVSTCDKTKTEVRVTKYSQLCDPQDRSLLERISTGVNGIAMSVPLVGGALSTVTSSVFKGIKAIGDMFSGPSYPEMCTWDVPYCVPFCGGGTYMYGQRCVAICPSPYMADDKTLSCVLTCAPDDVMKTNRLTGNVECAEDCGLDIKVHSEGLEIPLCIPTTPLGFYNFTVYQSSFPAISCSKGTSHPVKIGHVYMDGSGVAKVSNLGSPTAFMAVSVNSEDLQNAWDMINDAYETSAKNKLRRATKIDDFDTKMDQEAKIDSIYRSKAIPIRTSFPLLYKFLADTGCPDFGTRFPTGSFVKGMPKFGKRARLIMLFDQRNMKALTIDGISSNLRYQTKEERPAAFLASGSLGGMGSSCETFLSDNSACVPFSKMRNFVNNDTVLGNFYPPLSFDPLTKQLRIVPKSYKPQTFFSITPLDDVNRPTADSCSHGVHTFNSVSHYDLPMPIVPSSEFNSMTRPDGFGYVTGGFPFKMLKMSFHNRGVFGKFTKSTMEALRVKPKVKQSAVWINAPTTADGGLFEAFFFDYIDETRDIQQGIVFGSTFYVRDVHLDIKDVRDVYVLSDPSSECFIACFSLLQCEILCDYNPPGKMRYYAFFRKTLSSDILAKMTDFSHLSVSGLTELVTATGIRNEQSKRTCSGKKVTYSCYTALLEDLGKGLKNEDQAKGIFELSLYTRSYVFYVPPSLVDYMAQESGSEAYNFEGLARSYASNITKWIDFSSGERRANANTLLQYIHKNMKLLSFEPKSRTMYSESVAILQKIDLDYLNLDQKSYAAQLSAGGVILIHICLYDQQVARYNRTRRGTDRAEVTFDHDSDDLWGPTTLNQYRRLGEEGGINPGQLESELHTLVSGETPSVKPFEILSDGSMHDMMETRRLFGTNTFEYARNVSKPYGQENILNSNNEQASKFYREKKMQSTNCKDYQKSGTFCLIGMKPNELSTIRFMLHHESATGMQQVEFVQVCYLKAECRSNRFKVPGSKSGYVMFIMDFRNNVLRFDLLGFKEHKNNMESWLSYLAHGYARPECFREGQCYFEDDDGEWSSKLSAASSTKPFSQENKLVLRNDQKSDVFSEIGRVFIDMIRIKVNDTEFFEANPMTTYVLPCNMDIATNPNLNRHMLIAIYVDFGYSSRRGNFEQYTGSEESQQVLFAYQCEGVCERRTLSVGLGLSRMKDTTEFQFQFEGADTKRAFEEAFGNAPLSSNRKLAWERKCGLPSDAYDLSKASISIKMMEAILKYTMPYKDMVSKFREALKTHNENIVSGFSFMADKILERLKTQFTNITLSRKTRSVVDEDYGELYRLTEAPGDEYARLMSELKAYSLMLNTSASLLNFSSNVVSRKQIVDSQKHLNTFLDTLVYDLPEMHSSLSGFSGVANPVTWKKLNNFFLFFKLPALVIYPYIIVSYGQFRVQIDREVSAEQVHCINQNMAPCIMGKADMALFVRYKMNTDTGHVDIQAMAPCVRALGTSPCEKFHIPLDDMKGSDTGIFTIKQDKYMVGFSRTAEDFERIHLSDSYGMHPISFKTFINETRPERLLAVIKSLSCGSNFDINDSLSRYNCSCIYPYAAPSCKCNKQLHFYEDEFSKCQCDSFRNFAPDPANDKVCICDPAKGLVANLRNVDECVCQGGTNMVFNNVTGRCECNKKAGLYPDPETNTCVQGRILEIEVTSVRRVSCGAEKKFNFGLLSCTTELNTNKQSSSFESAGSYNNEVPDSFVDSSSELPDPGALYASGNTASKTLSYREWRDYVSIGSNIGDNMDVDISDPTLAQALDIFSSNNSTKLCHSYRIGDSSSDQEVIEGVYSVAIPLRPNGFASHEDILKLGLNTIVEVRIFNTSMDSIPSNFFSGLRNIYKLTIENCELTSLTNGQAFAGLESIYEVSLAKNKIKFIGEDAFSGFTDVKILDLRSNNLKQLDAKVFCFLHTLQHLYLDASVDVCLPAALFTSKEFAIETADARLFIPSKDLDTRYKCTDDKVCKGLKGQCSITSGFFPPTMLCKALTAAMDAEANINAQIALQMKDVDGRTIEVKNIKFSTFFSISTRKNMKVKFEGRDIDLTSFTTLIIRNANLGALSSLHTQGLYFIKKYILHNCGITSINGGVFKPMTVLSDLYITGNNITSIDESAFRDVRTLKVLNLNTNQIQFVSEKAFRLGSLEELYLSGNLIEQLPVLTFVGLSSLKVLEINSNQIQSFPQGLLQGLSSLQIIDLSDNVNGLITNLFDDVPSIPFSINIGVLSVLCVPHRIHTSSVILPTKEVSFCRDVEALNSISAKEKCPSEFQGCPQNGRVCNKHKDCNLSRFKGTFNFCSSVGLCSCGEYLTGARCNIPSATITARISGNTMMYFNVPLYKGSVQRYIPRDSDFIIIETPFFDNGILNGGVLSGLKKLKGVEIQLLVPPLEPIVPDSSFFLDNPGIAKVSDVRVVTPLRNERDLTKYLQKSDTNYVSNENKKFALRDRRNEIPNANADACMSIEKAFLDTIKSFMFRVDPTIAQKLGLIVTDFQDIYNSDKPKCGFEGVDSVVEIKGSAGAMRYSNKGNLMSRIDNRFFSRVVVITSTDEGVPFRFLQKVACVEEVEINVVIDVGSNFWPNVPLLCGGKANLLEAPLLKGIGPMHFSVGIRNFFPSNLYINYGRSKNRNVICEPRWLFRVGKRVNQDGLLCYDCEVPHKCDFFIMDFGIESEKLLSTVQVFPSDGAVLETQRPSLCQALADAFAASKTIEMTEGPKSVSLQVSSCQSLQYFKSKSCTAVSRSASNVLKKVSKFSIVPYGSIGQLVCQIFEMDIRCFEDLKKAQLNFFTELPIFIYFPSGYLLQKKFSSMENTIPTTAVLVVGDAAVSHTKDHSHSTIFDLPTFSAQELCSSKAIEAEKCEREKGPFVCNGCHTANYKEKCFMESCPSSVQSAPCSGHGKCVNGICHCKLGWHSSDCSVRKCGKEESLLQCSGRGLCGSYRDACNCFDGIQSGSECGKCGNGSLCIGESVCLGGACKCPPLRGGRMCQYILVNATISSRSLAGKIATYNSNLLLKPFMFAEPEPLSSFVPDVLTIVSIQLKNLASLAGEQSGPFERIPPYTFYGLRNVESLDLMGLEYVRSKDLQSLEVHSSSRALDTLTNLRFLSMPLSWSFCASKTKQFVLKNLNMWTRDCTSSPGCCSAKDIVPTPPAIQIYPRRRTYSTRDFLPVELVCSSWKSVATVDKIIRYDFSVPIVWTSYPSASQVRCVDNVVKLSVGNPEANKYVRRSDSQGAFSKGLLKVGSKIMTSREFNYGSFKIKIELPCSTTARSRYASVWLSQESFDFSNRRYVYPCTGALKLLDVFYSCIGQDCSVVKAAYDFPYLKTECSSMGMDSRKEVMEFTTSSIYDAKDWGPYYMSPMAFPSRDSVVDCFVSSDAKEELSQFEKGFLETCESNAVSHVPIDIDVDWSENGFRVELAIPTFKGGVVLGNFTRTQSEVPALFMPHKLLFQYGAGTHQFNPHESTDSIHTNDNMRITSVHYSEKCLPEESLVYILQERSFPECSYVAIQQYLHWRQFKRISLERSVESLVSKLESPFCTLIITPFDSNIQMFEHHNYAVQKMKGRCLTAQTWENALTDGLRKLGMFYIPHHDPLQGVHLSCAGYDAADDVSDRRRISVRSYVECEQREIDCMENIDLVSLSSIDNMGFFARYFYAMSRPGDLTGGNTIVGFQPRDDTLGGLSFMTEQSVLQIGHGSWVYFKKSFKNGFHLEFSVQLDVELVSYGHDEILFAAAVLPVEQLKKTTKLTNTTSESVGVEGKYFGVKIRCAKESDCDKWEIDYGLMYAPQQKKLFDSVYNEDIYHPSTTGGNGLNPFLTETVQDKRAPLHISLQVCFGPSPIFLSGTSVNGDFSNRFTFKMFDYEPIHRSANTLLFQTNRRVVKAKISDLQLELPGQGCDFGSCDFTTFLQTHNDKTSVAHEIKFVGQRYKMDNVLCPVYRPLELVMVGTVAFTYQSLSSENSIPAGIFGKYTMKVGLNLGLLDSGSNGNLPNDLSQPPFLDFELTALELPLIKLRFISEKTSATLSQVEVATVMKSIINAPTLLCSHGDDKAQGIKCPPFMDPATDLQITAQIPHDENTKPHFYVYDLMKVCDGINSCFVRVKSEQMSSQFVPLASIKLKRALGSPDPGIYMFIDTSLMRSNFKSASLATVSSNLIAVQDAYDLAKEDSTSYFQGLIPVPHIRITSDADGEESAMYEVEEYSAIEEKDVEVATIERCSGPEEVSPDCLSYLTWEKPQSSKCIDKFAYIFPKVSHGVHDGATNRNEENIPDLIYTYPLTDDAKTVTINVNITLLEGIDYPDNFPLTRRLSLESEKVFSVIMTTRYRLFQSKVPVHKLDIRLKSTDQSMKSIWSYLFPIEIVKALYTAENESERELPLRTATQKVFRNVKTSSEDSSTGCDSFKDLMQYSRQVFCTPENQFEYDEANSVCLEKSNSKTDAIIFEGGSYKKMSEYGGLNVYPKTRATICPELCKMSLEPECKLSYDDCVKACQKDIPDFLGLFGKKADFFKGKVFTEIRIEVKFKTVDDATSTARISRYELDCEVPTSSSKSNDEKTKVFSVKRDVKCFTAITFSIPVTLSEYFEKSKAEFPIFGFTNNLSIGAPTESKPTSDYKSDASEMGSCAGIPYLHSFKAETKN